MERLTKRVGANDHAFINWPGDIPEIEMRMRMTARLAAYEDTGLTPEQVKALADQAAKARLYHGLRCKSGTSGDMSLRRAWMKWNRRAETEPLPVKRERTAVGDYCCPACNAAFIDGAGTTPYCGNCGQRLAWE